MNQMKMPLNLFFFPAMLCAIFLSFVFRWFFIRGTERTGFKRPESHFQFCGCRTPVITKFISEITKKNFVFDERVKAR